MSGAEDLAGRQVMVAGASGDAGPCLGNRAATGGPLK
jgi:hypothetical protein